MNKVVIFSIRTLLLGFVFLSTPHTLRCEAEPEKVKDSTPAFGVSIPVIDSHEIWKNPSKTPEERAADLVRRLSVLEKIAQIQMDAPAIPRLGIPSYHWWNESLHGVARAGIATVFPQAIAAAATWDPELWDEVATAISDEARAKHHDFANNHKGNSAQYYGLDMWSPNVNIFRDPRWGRGQETYGEDPYLTARMGVAFVKGLEGNDHTYIKVIATPKHFAVHSGPESSRHTFDAIISDQDLWETYLPAFEACFCEGKAYSVMAAYNSLRGESCSSHPLLLGEVLRKKWGFNGYSVSDVDSVADIWISHHITKTAAEAAAHALKNGLDLNSGDTYSNLVEALQLNLCSQADIDLALRRCMVARFRLGMFDPVDKVTYAQIPMDVNDSPEHDALSLQTSREAMVLLKNEDRVLPLTKSGIVAVIGPNADAQKVLLGNYEGTPSRPVTVLAGIRKKLAGKASVIYAKGFEMVEATQTLTDEAVQAAQKADVVIMVMGINPELEGEEMPVKVPGFSGGDRLTLDLPDAQEQLIKNIVAIGKPVILVLLNGSALAINWEKSHVPAILEGWYPGQRGGDAVAEVLFGDYNPAGRLPVTFYRSEKDLPAFGNYNMKGRTYRYFTGQPLFQFGFGMSYTTFKYSDLNVTANESGAKNVSVKVKNTGKIAGDEVVQLYINRKDAPEEANLPLHSLRAFKRVNLRPDETKTVIFRLTPFQFAFVDTNGLRTVEKYKYTLNIGGSQRPEQSAVVRFSSRIVDPPYAHFAPEEK